ncbi:unannotated protein [freshwater metagenome]|uniref:Unannotated protein n=1 Tax=freshwater metagenome TaxID=449393 RepID=A0A6J7DJL6_9ZZZZ|nr:hypothetical protein [Actinomycetota bacterium]
MAEPVHDHDALEAGDFSVWLGQIQMAIRGEGESDVPCGDCTACCTASQFIHIGPDETDTLAHIPAPLLFPAPLLPRGHVLMGYDEHGRCPMLVDDRCSIYDHRPQTCRAYDCRVFVAAGVQADADKVLIVERARRWRFSFPTLLDHDLFQAVHAAAVHIRSRADESGAAGRPANNTQLAVAAIEQHERFLPQR